MRNISGSVETAIESEVLRPVYLVALEFGGSTVLNLNDRGRDITWDSRTWLGNGWLRPIRSVQETPEIKATGCEITLAGEISQLLAAALNEVRLSNKGTVYLGFLNSSDALISDPYLLFRGNLDVPTITTSGREVELVLTFESELRGLFRQKEFRYTDQSQQAFFPGDKGFQYVAAIENWSGFWGKAQRPSWVVMKRNIKK